MKTRESLLTVGLAAGLMAGCLPHHQEDARGPDGALMQDLPAAVEHHIADVAKVHNQGKNNGSGIRIAIGNKAVYLTANHVANDLLPCETGELQFLEKDIPTVEQYLPRIAREVTELAVLDAETTGHPKGAAVATSRPAKGDTAYFITYQSDHSVQRGPYEEGEYQKPATFAGTVIASNKAELRIATPANDASLPTDFGGSSGSGVFTPDGKVSAIVNKAGLAPVDADELNASYGTQLQPGSYDQLIGVPLTDTVMTDLIKTSQPQNCQ